MWEQNKALTILISQGMFRLKFAAYILTQASASLQFLLIREKSPHQVKKALSADPCSLPSITLSLSSVFQSHGIDAVASSCECSNIETHVL